MNKISKQLLKIAQEISAVDETNIANKKGVYHSFTGKIEWGDINGQVENAHFRLDYGSFIGGQHRAGIIWESGRWIDGIWDNGQWNDGLWENGTWISGAFHNGSWKNGYWKDGEWVDGLWYNGTWENGKWYNGIWKNGTWLKGEEARHFKSSIKHGNGDSPDKWCK